MLTLAQATKETRTLLKFGGIIVGAIFLIIILFNFSSSIRSTFFPPPPPPPEQKFGKLPKVDFPTSENLKINYRLNTITGTLPAFPDRLKVYSIKKPEPNLLNLQNVRNNLKNVNFTTGETELSETVFKWTNTTTPIRTINYDILSNNFDISSDYLNNNSFSTENLPLDKQAQSFVINFLTNSGENLDDIDRENASISYFKILNNNLVRVNNPQEAQTVKVDVIQKAIDQLNIFYPEFEGSTMSFLIGSDGSQPIIFQAHFKHQPINTNSSSTYPIITSQQALEQLKQGKAYIFNPEKKQNVEITDIYLGYYLGEKDQEYLMPIVIFKGKNFQAYVQAIPDSSITK